MGRKGSAAWQAGLCESGLMRLGLRVVGFAVLMVGVVVLGQVACRGTKDGDAGVGASGSAVHAAALPAGGDVRALLGGLQVGDSVEGYEVTWIGAVREDGGVALRLEQGGRRMRLAVALDTDHPRPPVRTERYALYYEDMTRLDTASEEDCVRVMEALAKRIRKVEKELPTPAGMRALPTPAATM